MSKFLVLLVLVAVLLVVLYIKHLMGFAHKRKKIVLAVLNIHGVIQRNALYDRMKEEDRSFNQSNFTATLELMLKHELINIEPLTGFCRITNRGRAHLASLRA